MTLKHPRPYWFRLLVFGMTIDVRWHPTKQRQRYRDLTQLIYWEKDPQRKMELIAERSILGNKYDLLP